MQAYQPPIKGFDPKSVIATARDYVKAGLSVVRIGLGTKWPSHAWKVYQERLPTDAELVKLFADGRAGIGVVCGPVSGGLEVIDFDDAPTWNEYWLHLTEEAPELAARLTVCATPSGGAHVRYRCDQVEANEKLAWPQEDGESVKALIETRGQGGQALAPGSHPTTHPTGKPYLHLSGPPMTAIGRVTPDERAFLLDFCRSFCRRPRPAPAAPADSALIDPALVEPLKQFDAAFNPSRKRISAPDDISAWDDFDRRGPTFEELLDGTGAVFVRGGGDFGLVRRPGKGYGHSATVGHCRSEAGELLMKVFTSSWPPLELGRCYGRFNMVKALRFAGDGSAAARWCREQGFGAPSATRGAGNPRPEEDAEEDEIASLIRWSKELEADLVEQKRITRELGERLSRLEGATR